MTTISRARSSAADAPPEAQPLVGALERVLVAGIAITSAALHDVASQEDLTLGQWRALAVINAAEHLRTGELALRLAIAVPSASRLVRRLEERGLVMSQRDEDDRRATLITPTPRGHQVFELVSARRRALIAQAVVGEHIERDVETSLDRLAGRMTEFA